MRSTNLPQPIAVRLLDLDERVTELVKQADKADATLAFARDIINGKREVDRIEFNRERDGFDAVVAAAKEARQRADSERGMLQNIRTWVASLPHNTKLLCVPPPNNGEDLNTLQAKLQALREELTQLNNITVPADNIGTEVKAYVQSLAAQAAPMLRGLGNGQRLEILWPGGPDCNRRNGSGFSSIDGNGLYFFALLMPDALASAILRAVQATQPMDREELDKRRSVLPDEINELSYVVAALRERAGMSPDPSMSPQHWLGVKIKEEETNKIAV